MSLKTDRHALSPLVITCEGCGAKPGQPCTTQYGEKAQGPHVARLRVVHEVWLLTRSIGYRDAIKEG